LILLYYIGAGVAGLIISGVFKLLFLSDNCSIDTDRRELRHEGELRAVEPQVFDLLEFLIRNRDRMVSRDDLLAAVWNGRIVSESTLASRINAARTAIGDNGEDQRLIRTILRKGIRFVGAVREEQKPQVATTGVAAEQPNLSPTLRSILSECADQSIVNRVSGMIRTAT
jgi:DNA-binding winged helix-turn-helix (wHTH) protein